MLRRRKGTRRTPPLVGCRECGRLLRSWSYGPLCQPCRRRVSAEYEPGWTRRARPRGSDGL